MGGHVKYSGGQGKLAKAAAAASSGNQSVSAIGQVQIFSTSKLVSFRIFLTRILFFGQLDSTLNLT